MMGYGFWVLGYGDGMVGWRFGRDGRGLKVVNGCMNGHLQVESRVVVTA